MMTPCYIIGMGGVAKSRSTLMGGIAKLSTCSIGGIAKFRGENFPDSLFPPPAVVNDVSLNTNQKEFCGYLAYLPSYAHLSHGIFFMTQTVCHLPRGSKLRWREDMSGGLPNAPSTAHWPYLCVKVRAPRGPP